MTSMSAGGPTDTTPATVPAAAGPSGIGTVLSSAATYGRLAALAVLGFGMADILHFHQLPSTTDLTLALSAAAALGAHLSYTMGTGSVA